VVRLSTDDLEVRVPTRLGEGGDLMIRQQTTNHARQALSFRCWVDAPRRRRLESMIVNLGVGATDTRRYRFERGRSLIGQRLRLGLEQSHGPRRVNREFVAQP